jgi:chemotaxis protein methyltransferase CheR
MASIDISDAEISCLLEAIFQQYGYDFRQYARAHIARRLSNRMLLSNIRTPGALHERALHDSAFASQLLLDLSITVTEMFRDPAFYAAIREKVVPLLKTYSFIKIWHAGCSTGEEVYSMAILLQEENLYDRTTIYATDFNQVALDKAREGIFSTDAIREYTQNYQRSGGCESLGEYYTAQYNRVIMNRSLKKNIVWANHNLVTDQVFAEMHLIFCRNVLIYFDKELQNRVQGLFYKSLIPGGVLCLGSKESLRFSDYGDAYSEIDKKNRIFKKKYGNI